jgi:hypothetical protein
MDAPAFAEQARRLDAYWITSTDDLLFVVMESLERLQKELIGSANGEILEFWEYRTRGKRRTHFRPRLETEIARRVAIHLRRDLSGRQNAIIRREAEVQWDERRTDIEVIVHGQNARYSEEWVVTIEAKGCWNTQVRVAVKKQLVSRYLTGCGRAHGIYLVAWFRATGKARGTKLKLPNREAVTNEFQRICDRAVIDQANLVVRPFVLDCRLEPR